MRLRHYYVYIMGNNRPTLYLGVTNNLGRRTIEHKHKLLSGFTSEYDLVKLLHYEEFIDISEAIKREKQLKHWKRDWKLKLIAHMNPRFQDLCDTLI